MIAKQLTQTKQTRQFVQTFSGLNRRLRAAEGEFLDMSGLCLDEAPVLTTAEPVEEVLSLPSGITAMCGGDKLCYTRASMVEADGSILTEGLWIAGQQVDGLSLDPVAPGGRQLIRMGGYLLLLPDKIFVNAETREFGKMEADVSTPLSTEAPMHITMCHADGSDYASGELTYSASEPESPDNGHVWVDTSGETVEAKRYSVSLKTWVSMGTTYVKLSGIYTTGLKELDGVEIDGGTIVMAGSAIAGSLRIVFDMNGNHVLQRVGEDFIVLIGILPKDTQQGMGTLRIRRRVPDMDYVVECQNRLWGCKYGQSGGEMLNEIYACALGDFTNWQQFQGLATDSYTASRGTPGAWTGAAVYNGSPIFYKNNTIDRVYVSASGAHQIVTTSARGAHGRSAAVVGGVLYYKSAYDVCAYDGTEPVGVSASLGDLNLASPYAAGSYWGKYYLSAAAGSGVGADVKYLLLSYDPQTGVWSIEQTSPEPIRFIATVDANTLYWGTDKKIYRYDEAGTVQDWRCESGVIGCATPDNKYISRLGLRLHLAKGGSCNVFVQYDSCGEWVHKACIPGKGRIESVVVPILPRRCDHFRLKLSGSGLLRLYSMAKIQEEGSDIR